MEETSETVVELLKDQLAKTVVGAVAGLLAAKLTDKAYDVLVIARRSI